MKRQASTYIERIFEPEIAAELILDAVAALRHKKIDVLVVTGVSGVPLGAQVAALLKVKLAIVRRPSEHTGEGRCHSYNAVEGWLGGRWAFFDDFIASGNTFKRVKDAYIAACEQVDEKQTLVGRYMWSNGDWTKGGDL